MDIKIKTEDFHVINCQLLIEILAFQNVIIEMLLMKNNTFTLDEINNIQQTHISRIRNWVNSGYGKTPDSEQADQ